METARNATDPLVAGQAARERAAEPQPPLVEMPPPPPPPAGMTGPQTAPAANAMGSGPGLGPTAPVMDGTGALLYYAVWLPGPAGAPSGPPVYLPAGGGPMAAGGGFSPGMAAMPPIGGVAPMGVPVISEAQAHNQRLLVWAIILCVMAVHLPWIAYLVAVHGCWGTFLDACWQAPVAEGILEGEVDPFAETVGDPYLFARIVFLMLRVQTVLSGDWAEYSQAMQLSTGLGSFVLTRIVASNGLVMESRGKAIYLAALCLTLFVILFWAELHLTSELGHPLLGDDTVLDYISQTLPPDFASYGSVRDGLMHLLQFLRLADALILGACLALPTTQRKIA